MNIPGVPSGWELVRIGVPENEDWILIGGKPWRASDFPSPVHWPIVRKVEAKPEPEPGEGWRWVEIGEELRAEDQYFSKYIESWVVNRATFICGIKHRWRRRVGPRLRQRGERIGGNGSDDERTW